MRVIVEEIERNGPMNYLTDFWFHIITVRKDA